MCDLGYLCANFSLPRPLCPRLRPDVRDRQTSGRQTDRRHHCIMPPPYGAGHNKIIIIIIQLFERRSQINVSDNAETEAPIKLQTSV